MAIFKYKTLKRELLVISLILLLVFVIVLGVFSAITIRQQTANREKEIVFNRSLQLRNTLKDRLEHALDVVRNISQVYTTSVRKNASTNLTRQETDEIMKEALRNNDDFHGIYTLWEPGVFEQEGALFGRIRGYDENERYIPYWRKDTTGNFIMQSCMYYNTEGVGNYYLVPRRRMRESIIDPFLYPYQHVEVPMISLTNPIIYQNRFYGVTGIDMPVTIMQRILESASIYDANTEISLISYNGIYAANSRTDTLMGVSLENMVENFNEQVVDIQNSTKRYLIEDGVLKVKVPLEVGNTGMPWQLRVEIPAQAIYQKANWEIGGLIVMAILIFLIGIGVYYLYINNVTKSLQKLGMAAEQLSHGNLHTNIDADEKNEIGTLAGDMKEIRAYMQEIEELSKALSSEDFSSAITLRGEEDELGRSVNRMIKELQRIDKENEQQRKDAEIRNWSRNGLAELGSVLNQRSDNLEEFTYAILEQVLNYLDITVGGIYIYKKAEEEKDANDDYLQMTAAYAFDRRKYLQRQIALGEGLVGTCALEREMIYMTRIPEGYVEIAGGLGSTKPRSLLLYPLIEQEEMQGILELVSLKELKDYEIEFVKEAGKNIAVTLTAAKINARTNELLQQSRKQAEELASQEEEMRQNLEELQATQEESRRREAEMSGILNALNNAFYVLELSLEGVVMNVNEQYLQRIGFSKEQAEKSSFSEFSPLAEEREQYERLFNTLRQGKSRVEEIRQKMPNGDIAWFREYFNPIFDKEGKPYKILNISFDITRQKVLQREIEHSKAKSEGILEALNASIGIVEFYHDGRFWRVKSANDIFLNSLNVKAEEVKDQLHSYLISAREANSTQYINFWQDISQGIKRSVERKYELEDGAEVWKYETFTPVKDEKGLITHLILLAIDITEAKQNETESRKQTQKLEEKEKELRDRLLDVEKLSRKSEEQKREMQSILNAIDKTAYYAEFDTDGYFTNINKPLLDLMGMDRKDVIGKHQTKVIKVNRYSSEYIQFWNDLRNGISKSFEEEREIINGKKFWVSQIYMPITNKEGKTERIFNLLFDITQQKAQEQKLRKFADELKEQKEKLDDQLFEYKGLIKAVDASIMEAEYSPEGVFLRVNEIYAAATGYSVDELMGANTADFVKKDEMQQYRYIMHKMREGEEIHTTVQRTNKVGNKVWAISSYVPYFDENQQLRRIYVLGVDITEHKQAEEQAIAQVKKLQEQIDKMNKGGSEQ